MERDRGEKEIMSEIEISPELLLDKGFMELLGESPESMEDIRQERELKVKDALLAGKILGEYQENIRKSETDKEAILKGLISGEPMSSLLYRALDIIGRLTGDKVFSETARKRGLYLYEVYEDEETIDELIKETAVPVRLIEAPAGKKFEKPVYLHYTYPNGSEDVDITFIHMEKGSNLTLIQYLDSDSINGSGFAGTQTKVVLEDDAVLHLIKVQCLPLDFVYFNDMGSFMKERAHFQYTELVLGGKNNYLGCAVDQTGRESDFKADLGFIVSNGNLLDLNYNDIFRGSKSKGVMRFNGVMIEGSKKASRETLDFRKGCIDADGDEEENILMLGPNIENRTIPLILGEEEKVNGRHAATAGKLSEDMLFYMETRGIDERQAREMMIRSNISKVTRLIPNEEIAMAADARIDRIFAACDGDCRNCPTAH